MRYGQLVSGNYFSVLGIQAAAGRTFLPEEDQTPGAHPIVVLSHNFWTRRLGGDPNVIGSTVVLNGRGFTVVGVAPSGFTGLLPGFGSDFWIPLMMAEQLGAGRLLENQSSLWLFVAGRMQPGVTTPQAQAELATLASQLAQANPDTHKNHGVIAVPMARALIGAGIAWALATAYFWLLNRTSGVAFILAMIGGLAIGLV